MSMEPPPDAAGAASESRTQPMVAGPSGGGTWPTLTVVVPTYREAENLPLLLERLAGVRAEHGLEMDVLIMDDNSRDGSEEAVAEAGHEWARLVVRTGQRGLSPAVLDGLKMARGEVVVVMDADLSHPPERIPDMLRALESGKEFVMGSRYVPGGTTDAGWGVYRWLNSKIATLMARPLTRVKDPMSGFFAMRRADLERAAYLNPVGYKIALELIVKCRLRDVGEVPIHFADRQLGESKLNLKEQLRYLQHLRRLYLFRYATLSHLLQFLVVGVSGLIVNLAILTLALWAGAADAVAVGLGIAVSVCTNFLLNRRFTFSYAKNGPVLRQFAGYVAASAAGAGLNYAVTLWVAHLQPEWPLQVAAIVGVAAGTGVNFLVNRYAVFPSHKKKK